MLNEGLIRALSQAIDLRDPFVEGHSQQVARYAVMTAREMGLDDARIDACGARRCCTTLARSASRMRSCSKSEM